MLNIAICDDEKEVCAYMEDVLMKIEQAFCQEISIEIFYS